MNYRHGFHAGNHADALKHSVLAAALAIMTAKSKPLSYLDLFAGAGRYDLLLDDRAQRTGEWRDGLGALWDGAAWPTAAAPYRSVVDALNAGGALRWCPGSPAIAQALLRPDDALRLVELQSDEANTLSSSLRGDDRARVLEQDGWAALASLTPPTPRRGLALIDPPFEKPGEFDRMVDAIQMLGKRWATGVALLWHPIVDRRRVDAYVRAATATAGETPLLSLELSVRPDGAGGLTGSGMICLNPPYGLAERTAEIGRFLGDTLAAPDAAGFAQRWLVEAR